MNAEVLIYLNCYSPYLLKSTVPGTVNLDISNNPEPELREFYSLRKIYKSKLYQNNGLTGLFSPKFPYKSKISCEDFTSWVKKNPGYDLYIINPFPQDAYFNINIWENSLGHKDLYILARNICRAAGFNYPNLLKTPRKTSYLSYCNFWVGNKSFWEQYIPYLFKIYDQRTRFNAELFSIDPNTGVPIFPYLFERLLTTFLTYESHNLKVLSYKYDDIENQCRTKEELAFLRYMMPFVDEFDSMNSQLSEHAFDTWKQHKDAFKFSQ